MKSVFAFVAVALALVGSALAGWKLELNPYDVGMEYTDVEYVDACIYDVRGETVTPVVGVPLVITDVCFDGNSDADCFDAEDSDTTVFFATVESSPTGDDGCGVVKLETVDAMGGSYAYVVNGMEGDNVKVKETGTAFIPEFTVIGSALVLGAAGLYSAKRRKQ